MPDLHTYDLLNFAGAKPMFESYGSCRMFKRGDYFCRMESPAREIGLVISGGFGFSRPDHKGHDQILSLAFEGEFVSAIIALLPGRRSAFDVRALCPSELRVLPLDFFFDKMEEMNPGFRLELTTVLAYGIMMRCISCRCDTPEDRYKDLLQRVPDVRKFVPMSTIASYLGLSREAFARMRSRID